VAPVGVSKTNKPIFLRHWVHCVPPATGETDLPPYSATAATAAASLGDGSLPGNRVLISASGKQGTWAPDTYFGAHKMSRKWSSKNSSAANFLSISSDLNKLRQALQAGDVPVE
jgi:hypothetical protein